MRTNYLHITRKKPLNFQVADGYLFEREWFKRIETEEIQFFFNVTILPNQVILQNNQIIEQIITRTSYNASFKNFIKKSRLETIKIKQAIWLTDLWSSNYFHWFTDVLPRLFIVEKKYSDISVILPASFSHFSYIIESLTTFSDIKIVWYRNFQKLKVKELIYIPPSAPTGNYNEKLIREVSYKLRTKFELSKIVAENNIMINRQHAPNRKIINQKEFDIILDKNKIQNVIFEKKAWLEQIKIAAKTNLLIGTHGVGLTNMLFMPKNSNILEFRRKDDAQNNCYFSLVSALNLNYYYQLCDVDDYAKTTQENNFYVDIVEFEKNIKQIIRE